MQNIEELKKSMNMKADKKGAKHTINVKAPFLPFKTRKPDRAKFGRRFNGIIGEVSRVLSENKLSKGFDKERCVDNIVAAVHCGDEEDRKYLRELIKNYLVDKDGDINVFHPHLFQYIQLSEGDESKGEASIAQFICDVILKHDCKFKDLFVRNETNHMITKLILSELDDLEKKGVKDFYVNHLDYISNVAIEDINFIMNHEEFFLNNFANVLAYYYFFYITQLAIKLNKRSEAKYSEIEEIYYLLDWEKPSKNRKCVEKGYKFIKEQSKQLLIHIDTIEHLNFIFGEFGKNFVEINDIFNNMISEEQAKILEALKYWVEFYRDFYEKKPIELPLDYKELVKALSDSLIEQNQQAILSRYALSIEEIGKKYFLKLRGGTYGYMLNITQEMLVLITAISIKEEKITLKALFKEYEIRGLFFDNYSKESIVELLEKLNLIDKKSDSGDAQYVKAIL
ncbi:DNA phosphorothioation-dependent restriction protein DptG [Clostridium sp. CH2]|uniref:DNA phosphorothioation-dependent restriction protein DptG n=1 Tax=Clostridium sp. CH2 TaxID=2949990 RepID=UPI00207A0AFD|nr:DNA phosphorothioation-dependent restriction protein DptG [Clostridium sp. CH2]